MNELMRASHWEVAVKLFSYFLLLLLLFFYLFAFVVIVNWKKNSWQHFTEFLLRLCCIYMYILWLWIWICITHSKQTKNIYPPNHSKISLSHMVHYFHFLKIFTWLVRLPPTGFALDFHKKTVSLHVKIYFMLFISNQVIVRKQWNNEIFEWFSSFCLESIELKIESE